LPTPSTVAIEIKPGGSTSAFRVHTIFAPSFGYYDQEDNR
jgi:hypothetical protein